VHKLKLAKASPLPAPASEGFFSGFLEDVCLSDFLQVLELANFEGQGVSGEWILVVDAPQTDAWNEVPLETTSARFLIGFGIPQ